MNLTISELSVPWIKKRESEIWNNEFVFEQGLFHSIIAPSGSGKTTFILLTYGIIKGYSGKISIDEKEYTDLDHYTWSQVRSTQIAIMFQDLRLFPELSGFENIELKNRLTSYFTKKEIMEKAESLGISDILHRRSLTYSLGEQQRCAFLRTLCMPFNWILLDEPFSHVDKENKKKMAEMLTLQTKNNNAGLIAVFLEHEGSAEWDRELQL